jgi:hypothetical protein
VAEVHLQYLEALSLVEVVAVEAVVGASAALDNPNINLLFVSTRLKLTYPSPLILSVEKVPLPPQALLVLIVVRVLKQVILLHS